MTSSKKDAPKQPTEISYDEDRRRVLKLLGITSGALMFPGLTIGNGAVGQTPQKGGALHIVHRPINILNPAIQSGIATMMPGAQLFAGLVQYDDEWNPHPYLAERWEAASDNLSHTFHLRKGALFHDGKEITSEDVAFSLEIVKNHHPFGGAMFGTVEKVDTPDPYTAIFRLRTPLPALVISTSSVLLPIIPKHIYSTAPIRTHPANNNPIGSGPFKLKEYKPGAYLILERFDDFFGEGPYLDRLIYHIMKDPNSVTLGLQRGKLDYAPYAPVPKVTVERIQQRSPELKVTHEGYEAIGPINWLAFNLRVKPLDDVRVRQAIAYAIDRQFICDALFRGATPATGPIVPSSPYYYGDVNTYPFNVEKANALLDEAGYPRRDGSRFTLTLDTYPGQAERGHLPAQYMKAQLPSSVGINIHLREAPDFPTWARRISTWNFELTMDQVFNYPDPTIGVERTYVCDNIIKGVIWSNTQGYCNPEVDKLFALASVETDFQRRKKLYADVQKILVRDLPVYWINVINYSTIYNTKVKNVPLSIWGAMAPFNRVFLSPS